MRCISTHAPAGGATAALRRAKGADVDFYSRPCGRGDNGPPTEQRGIPSHFYSRPCGRGDGACLRYAVGIDKISTHAPAGGATYSGINGLLRGHIFLLTPLREGRQRKNNMAAKNNLFLLTPLREGRPHHAGRGNPLNLFLLTPLREGRRALTRF